MVFTADGGVYMRRKMVGSGWWPQEIYTHEQNTTDKSIVDKTASAPKLNNNTNANNCRFCNRKIKADWFLYKWLQYNWSMWYWTSFQICAIFHLRIFLKIKHLTFIIKSFKLCKELLLECNLLLSNIFNSGWYAWY